MLLSFFWWGSFRWSFPKRASTQGTAFSRRIYGTYQASVFQILKSKLLFLFLVTTNWTFWKAANKPLVKSSLLSPLPCSPFDTCLQVSAIPRAWTEGNACTQMSATAHPAGGEGTAISVSTSTAHQTDHYYLGQSTSIVIFFLILKNNIVDRTWFATSAVCRKIVLSAGDTKCYKHLMLAKEKSCVGEPLVLLHAAVCYTACYGNSFF